MNKGNAIARVTNLIYQQSRSFKQSNRSNAKDLYSNYSCQLTLIIFVEILGVSRGVSSDDIKKAYFKLAKQYHPDINKQPEAKEKFAEINDAYETLSDESKKKIYDSTGMTGNE